MHTYQALAHSMSSMLYNGIMMNIKNKKCAVFEKSIDNGYTLVKICYVLEKLLVFSLIRYYNLNVAIVCHICIMKAIQSRIRLHEALFTISSLQVATFFLLSCSRITYTEVIGTPRSTQPGFEPMTSRS